MDGDFTLFRFYFITFGETLKIFSGFCYCFLLENEKFTTVFPQREMKYLTYIIIFKSFKNEKQNK